MHSLSIVFLKYPTKINWYDPWMIHDVVVMLLWLWYGCLIETNIIIWCTIHKGLLLTWTSLDHEMGYESTTPSPTVRIITFIYTIEGSYPIMTLIDMICWIFERVVTHLQPFEPFYVQSVSILISIIN